MIKALLSRIDTKQFLKSPLGVLSTFNLILDRDYPKANSIFLKYAKKNQSILKSKNLKQQDKLLDFLCDLHLQNTLRLNSGVYNEYSWMFTKDKGKIRLSRAWIWAIQSELDLFLIPKELLLVLEPPSKNLILPDTIHHIHRATYNILNYKGIKPTYSLIYRNVINDDREISTQGSIEKVPKIDYNVITLDEIVHFRCCSIKPHGCENYDFNVTEKNMFVVARGMVEKGYGNFEPVMPTILFTDNHLDIGRFKSVAEYKDVLVLNREQTEGFLYLYEN